MPNLLIFSLSMSHLTLERYITCIYDGFQFFRIIKIWSRGKWYQSKNYNNSNIIQNITYKKYGSYKNLKSATFENQW